MEQSSERMPRSFPGGAMSNWHTTKPALELNTRLHPPPKTVHPTCACAAEAYPPSPCIRHDSSRLLHLQTHCHWTAICLHGIVMIALPWTCRWLSVSLKACHGTDIGLYGPPGHDHGLSRSCHLPHHCHDTAMALPCSCHGGRPTLIGLPWDCHGTPMV